MQSIKKGGAGIIVAASLLFAVFFGLNTDSPAKTIFGVYLKGHNDELQGESLQRLQDIHMPMGCMGYDPGYFWHDTPSYLTPWEPKYSNIPETLYLEDFYHNHIQTLIRTWRPFNCFNFWTKIAPSDIFHYPTNGQGMTNSNALDSGLKTNRYHFGGQVIKADLAGKTFTLSLWAKATSGDVFTVYFTQYDLNGNNIFTGAFDWNSLRTISPGTDYALYSGSRTMLTNTASVHINFYHLSGAGTIYVDDVSMVEVGKTNNFLENGDFENGYSYWRDRGDMPAAVSMKVSFAEYCRLWLEFEKRLISELYRNGIYIIDVGMEVNWPEGMKTGHGITSYKNFTLTPEEALALGEVAVRQIIKDTYKDLYLWKNRHFPKVVLGLSLICDSAKKDYVLDIHKDLPWFDWIGLEGGPSGSGMVMGDYTDFNTPSPGTNRMNWRWSWGAKEAAGWDIQRGDIPAGQPGYNMRELPYDKVAFVIDHKYIYDEEVKVDGVMKPYEWYHNTPRITGSQEYCRAWGWGNFENYKWDDPSGASNDTETDNLLEKWKLLESTYGADKNYLKLLLYADWVGYGPTNSVYYADKYCFLNLDDLSAREKFNYARDNILNPGNPDWGSALWPLVVRNEDISYDSNNNRITLTLRNLCADVPLSSRIQIFARTASEGPPWRDIADYPGNTNAFIKACPEDIRASLIPESRLATVERNTYTVPNNTGPSESCLYGRQNILTLSVPLTKEVQDGDIIYVFVEDNELVKGWIACNDIPKIKKLSFVDASTVYPVPIRVRAEDRAGCFSHWTEGMASCNEKGHILVEASDSDGLSGIHLEYWSGVQWNKCAEDFQVVTMLNQVMHNSGKTYSIPYVFDWDPSKLNLLDNADFEWGTEGWFNFGQWQSDIGRDGSAGVKQSGYYQVAMQSLAVNSLVAGNTFRVSAYAKGEAGAKLGIYIIERDANGTALCWYNPIYQPLTSDYQKYEGGFTVQYSNCDHIDYWVYNASGKGTLYVDEAECVKTDDLNNLVNSAFEWGTEGWVNFGQWQSDIGRDGSAGVKQSGYYCVAMQSLAANSLAAGNTFRVSVCAKGEADAKLGIYIIEMDANGTALCWYNPIYQPLTSDYQKYEGVFTVQYSNCDHIDFWVYNASGKGTIYVDEAECVKTDDLNNLVNSAFEWGTEGWVRFGQWQSDIGRDGSAGVKQSGYYQVAMQNLAVNSLVAGNTFRVSAYAKGEAGAKLGIYINEMDANGTSLWWHNPIYQPLTPDYQKYEGVFTVHPGCHHVELWFYNASGKGTIYLDEAECVLNE